MNSFLNIFLPHDGVTFFLNLSAADPQRLCRLCACLETFLRFVLVSGGDGSLSQDASLSGMEASGVTFSESGAADDDSRQMDVDVEELEDDGQEAMVK